jgi:hypothetical protein
VEIVLTDFEFKEDLSKVPAGSPSFSAATAPSSAPPGG